MSDCEHNDIIYPTAIPFVLVHLACLAAIWTGITWEALAKLSSRAVGRSNSRVIETQSE